MTRALWVRPDLRDTFAGLAFDDFLALGTHEVRVGQRGARRTAWFERGGRRFFVKAHRGAGWGEILKSLLQLKRPVVDARVEARALRRLAELAIPAPPLAAFGAEGADPARRRSFVVTEGLEGAEALDAWLARGAPPFAVRRALTIALGALAGRLHAGRIAHQDLYLAHFLVRSTEAAAPEIWLIDMHRALPAPRWSRRWERKDLAALRSSTLALPVTRTDCARFLRAYDAGRGRARAKGTRERARRRRLEARAHAVRLRASERERRGGSAASG